MTTMTVHTVWCLIIFLLGAHSFLKISVSKAKEMT